MEITTFGICIGSARARIHAFRHGITNAEGHHVVTGDSVMQNPTITGKTLTRDRQTVMNQRESRPPPRISDSVSLE